MIKSLFNKSKKSKVLHNCNSEFIFIHIPKNAGTSISKSIGFNESSHAKASEIIDDFGKDYFINKFSFSIVRNPIQRFLSLYHYAKMDVSLYHNNLDPSKSLYGRHLDYSTLKDASIYDCAILLKEGLLKHDTSWNHWDPQYTWIYDKKENDKLIDKVYRLENLNELKKDFLDLFGIQLTLNNFNKSDRDNSDFLDKRTLSILREFYQKDFELFNYNY